MILQSMHKLIAVGGGLIIHKNKIKKLNVPLWGIDAWIDCGGRCVNNKENK